MDLFRRVKVAIASLENKKRSKLVREAEHLERIAEKNVGKVNTELYVQAARYRERAGDLDNAMQDAKEAYLDAQDSYDMSRRSLGRNYTPEQLEELSKPVTAVRQYYESLKKRKEGVKRNPWFRGTGILLLTLVLVVVVFLDQMNGVTGGVVQEVRPASYGVALFLGIFVLAVWIYKKFR